MIGLVRHSFDQFGNHPSTSRAGTTTAFGCNGQGDVASPKDPASNITDSTFDLVHS